MATNDSYKTLFLMKKQPVQSRSKITVNAIVEAAAQLLPEFSFSAVTTNHIAERAGVSIGSLYEYFPGKESIYAELKRRRTATWFSNLIAEPRPDEPQAIIRHLVEGQVEYCFADLELFIALETQLPKGMDQDINDQVFQEFKSLSTVWFRENGQKIRPDVEPAFLSEFLMHTVGAMVYAFVTRAQHDLDKMQLKAQLIDMLERYLLKN